MKNIEAILKEAGLEVTAEQLAAIEKAVKENYKTVVDYDKQKEKLDAAEDKAKTLEESLEKFKDVDPEALKQSIEDLKKELKQKDTEYAGKIADRDFEDVLKDAISGAKGKNAKAIRALLDLDTLKASKNQKDDVAAAIKALTEAEDSAFLFAKDDGDEPDDADDADDDAAGVVGKADVIGTVKGGSGDSFLAGLRSSMGLASSATEKKE